MHRSMALLVQLQSGGSQALVCREEAPGAIWSTTKAEDAPENICQVCQVEVNSLHLGFSQKPSKCIQGVAFVACCRHSGAALAGQALGSSAVEKSFGLEVGAEDNCVARSCSSR